MEPVVDDEMILLRYLVLRLTLVLWAFEEVFCVDSIVFDAFLDRVMRFDLFGIVPLVKDG